MRFATRALFAAAGDAGRPSKEIKYYSGVLDPNLGPTTVKIIQNQAG